MVIAVMCCFRLHSAADLREHFDSEVRRFELWMTKTEEKMETLELGGNARQMQLDAEVIIEANLLLILGSGSWEK